MRAQDKLRALGWTDTDLAKIEVVYMRGAYWLSPSKWSEGKKGKEAKVDDIFPQGHTVSLDGVTAKIATGHGGQPVLLIDGEVNATLACGSTVTDFIEGGIEVVDA